MFRKVVSNFRRKNERTRKSMKNSISSHDDNDFVRKFSTKFNSDDSLNSILSVFDSESELRHSECVQIDNNFKSQGIFPNAKILKFNKKNTLQIFNVIMAILHSCIIYIYSTLWQEVFGNDDCLR